jgi:PAS domain S-box-containing protein
MENDYLLRQLFDEAPVGYHELDKAGIIRRVNRACCELLGCPADALVGKPIWEIVIPEQRAAARDAVLRKLSGQLGLPPYEAEFQKPDGKRIDLEIHEHLMMAEDGSVCGLRIAGLDITRRKRAEREMRQNREWFRIILRSIGEGVLATDALGNVMFINPVAEELLGVAEAEVTGRDITRIFRLVDADGEPQHDWPIRRIVGEGTLKDWSGGLRIACPNGGTRPIEMTISSISDEANTVVGAVLIFRSLDQPASAHNGLICAAFQ